MTPTTQEERERLKAMYDESARRYYLSLPIEETIDTLRQANSRKIVLSSFSMMKAKRPDVHCFNELLIEYPGTDGKPGRVVPSNFIVIHPEPIKANNSFDISQQPARPFLALEYVTELRRPEFHQNRDKYERELRIPYYLQVYPHDEKFTLFQLRGGHYAAVTPNAAGRYPVPELELEAALLDGWVRFWFRGELLALPGDLLRERNTERNARQAAEARAAAAEAEIARLREELAKAKGLSGQP
ncbi:MAG: hypothetical protein C0467_23035 [Planctomycetaceae bacterium]|nr:hypothetical protein [Planctomycetaceae bacterium]